MATLYDIAKQLSCSFAKVLCSALGFKRAKDRLPKTMFQGLALKRFRPGWYCGTSNPTKPCGDWKRSAYCARCNHGPQNKVAESRANSCKVRKSYKVRGNRAKSRKNIPDEIGLMAQRCFAGLNTVALVLSLDVGPSTDLPGNNGRGSLGATAAACRFSLVLGDAQRVAMHVVFNEGSMWCSLP